MFWLFLLWIPLVATLESVLERKRIVISAFDRQKSSYYMDRSNGFCWKSWRKSFSFIIHNISKFYSQDICSYSFGGQDDRGMGKGWETPLYTSSLPKDHISQVWTNSKTGARNSIPVCHKDSEFPSTRTRWIRNKAARTQSGNLTHYITTLTSILLHWKDSNALSLPTLCFTYLHLLLNIYFSLL